MELSEEEKKAIEYFKRQIPKLENIIDWNETFYINPTQSKILKNSLITIINLNEKQQKEIEELKEKQDYSRLEKEQLLEDSISKDKIREKIKEYREETMRCQECKDYEDANINQRILLAFDKLLEE